MLQRLHFVLSLFLCFMQIHLKGTAVMLASLNANFAITAHFFSKYNGLLKELALMVDSVAEIFWEKAIYGNSHLASPVASLFQIPEPIQGVNHGIFPRPRAYMGGNFGYFLSPRASHLEEERSKFFHS